MPTQPKPVAEKSGGGGGGGKGGAGQGGGGGGQTEKTGRQASKQARRQTSSWKQIHI